MKIAALNNVNRQTLAKSTIAVTTAAAAVSTTHSSKKNTQKTTYDKDFGIWGRATAAEIQAAQDMAKIQGLKITPNSNIYILSGSSGVGKDTILRAFLAKHPEFKLSVSHTTRKQRPNEKDGIDYYFVNEEEFYHGIENGEFLEWANFSGNKYGTKKETINNILKKTNNVILKLDTKGALKIKKLIPQAKLIFVAPPSIKELEARLRGRGTESEDAIQRRLSAIKTEMKNSKQYDFQIVNDTVDNAVTSLEDIMKIN